MRPRVSQVSRQVPRDPQFPPVSKEDEPGSETAGSEASAALDQLVARLRPLRYQVVLEPAWPSVRRQSGLWRVPTYVQYPQAGWVRAKGETRESISIGDLALIEVESTDVARLYHQVFEVMFTGDQGSAFFDPDLEPIIREAVERFRANPTTDDRTIVTVELNGQGIRFDASDVLTYQWATTSSDPFTLLYPVKVRMVGIWLNSEAHLLYIIDEKDILGIIHDT